MGEIAGQREHETGDLAFTLGKIVDSVLIDGTVGRAPDDVEFERRFCYVSAPLVLLAFSAFESDAIEVVVFQQVEDGVHVIVKRFDGFGFEPVDASAQ